MEENGTGFDVDKMRQDMRKVVMKRIGPEIEIDYEIIEDFKITKPESQRMLSVIFIQNSAITFNLQISYSIEDALFFSNFKESGKETTDEKKAMAKDFVNELCNMAGGGIKHLVEEEGIDSLISLPVSTRTEDQDLFRAHPKGTSRVITDQWMLEHSEGNHSVLCYTKMEVLDEKAMKERIVPAFGGGDDAGGGVFFL